MGSSIFTVACGIYNSSLTWDGTQGLCIGSKKSYPLDHQGSPSPCPLFDLCHHDLPPWLMPYFPGSSLLLYFWTFSIFIILSTHFLLCKFPDSLLSTGENTFSRFISYIFFPYSLVQWCSNFNRHDSLDDVRARVFLIKKAGALATPTDSEQWAAAFLTSTLGNPDAGKQWSTFQRHALPLFCKLSSTPLITLHNDSDQSSFSKATSVHLLYAHSLFNISLIFTCCFKNWSRVDLQC